MKKIIGILFVLSSFVAFGQFPAPTNFDFSYEYIMSGYENFCAGEWIAGATYCSHFEWTVPDTNSTTATLECYNLYYKSSMTGETCLLTTTTELYCELEVGILGEVWVTAVYSKPDGESMPSNVIINEDLPLAVNELQLQNELNIFYDYKTQEIKITNGESISKINIYDSQGKLITTNQSSVNKISVERFPTGLYIVEVINNNQTVVRQKIIK